MKALNKIWIAAIAAVAMTACNNELSEQALNNGGNVNFTMGIGNTPSSRVSMPETGYTASFVANDEVGIFVAEQPSYTNVKYSTADGTTWTGGPVKVSADAAYTYYAYYPYAEGMTANNIPVVVATNQDTEGYIKNDYLYSKLSATAGQTDVKLAFDHALSLIEVTLAGSGAAEGATVDLLNVATDATIDLTAETPVTTGSTTATVTMDALSSLKYRAIVPAQKISASTPVFKIAVNGRTYQAKYSGVMKFEQGKYLAMTITLGEQSGDAEIEITASASINDWEAGSSNGGDASISVAELNIPLPTDGAFEVLEKGWSNSSIPAGGTDKWYVRDNVVDSTKILYSYSADNAAIEFKSQKYTSSTTVESSAGEDSIVYSTAYSRGSWNNDCAVFHSVTPLDTVCYKLSFKVKSTVNSGIVGVGVTSSADTKLFAMYDASGKYWSRTVTTYGSIGADDWIEKSVIINLAKYHTTGASSNVAVGDLKNSDISDVNSGVNLLFYNYTNGVENCLYLKDIKLEQYTGDITYN